MNLEVAESCKRLMAARVGRAPRKPRALSAFATRKARLLAAGHSCVKRSADFKCQVCGRRFPMNGLLRRFLPGRCSGARALAPEDPSCHPLYMHAGSSHTLEVPRGVLYCVVCGSFGTVNTRDLCAVYPPSRRPTKAGTEVLSRLSRGLTPKCGVPWPAP